VGAESAPTADTCIRLYDTLLQTNATKEEGNKWLRTFQTILDNNNKNSSTNGCISSSSLSNISSLCTSIQSGVNTCERSSVVLPKSFRTVSNILSKNVIGVRYGNQKSQCLYDLIPFYFSLSDLCEITFPKGLFPEIATFYSYDIIEVIGEALLNANPLLFGRNADNQAKDKDNSRVFEDFTTGLLFEAGTNAVRASSQDEEAGS